MLLMFLLASCVAVVLLLPQKAKKVMMAMVDGRFTTDSFFLIARVFLIQIGRCSSHAPSSERPAPLVTAILSPGLFMI